MSETNQKLKVWSPATSEMSEVMTLDTFNKNLHDNPILKDPESIIKYQSPLKTSDDNFLFENDYVSIENRLDDSYIIGVTLLTPDGFIIRNVFNHNDITDLFDRDSSIIAKLGSIEETPTLVADLISGI